MCNIIKAGWVGEGGGREEDFSLPSFSSEVDIPISSLFHTVLFDTESIYARVSLAPFSQYRIFRHLIP